jgi:hypothetical protein
MAVAMIGPKFYAWDHDGKPLAFGKLYTYQSRTNTPKATYQSEDQVVENTNPVILNGEGYADVYLAGSYKMVLKDSDDNEIWSSDPVTSASAEEWVNCFAATYVSTTSFKISGNQTDEYRSERKVRIDNNTSEYAYADILSSTYAGGETSVVINHPVVTTGILTTCTSIVSSESSFNAQDVGGSASYQAASVADIIAGNAVGASVSLELGQRWSADDYYGGATPSNSGVLFFKVVAAGTGAADGGKYINVPGGLYQLEQNLKIPYNVKAWGAVGNGLALDTSPIQNAVNYAVSQFTVNRKSIYLPYSEYLIDDTITVGINGTPTDKGGVLITGDSLNTEWELSGTRILSDMTKPQFLTQVAGVQFDGISFVHIGTPKLAGTIGVQLKLNDNADDMDSHITRCQFGQLDVGCDAWGRGFFFSMNLVRGCTTGIVRHWTPAGDFNDNPTHTNIPFGYRANRITNNRCHVTDVFVKVESLYGADFRGMVLANNNLDLGGKLFVGGGRNHTITGNVCDINTDNDPDSGIILFNTTLRDSTIAGNTFNGYAASGANNDEARDGQNGIVFFASSFSNTVTANSFCGFARACIEFREEIDKATITANTFDDSRWSYSFRNTTRNITASGNTFNNIDDRNAFGTGGVDNEFNELDLRRDKTSDTNNLAMSFKLGADMSNVGDLRLSSSGVELRSLIGNLLFTTPVLRPTVDNTTQVGDAGRRYTEIFAVNGTINTSDEREKDFFDIEGAEREVALKVKGLIRKFKWKDSLERESEGGSRARIHFGVSAQDVRDAFLDAGLNPDDYSLFCYDSWEQEVDDNGNVTLEAGDRYGIRYGELSMFIFSAI